MSENRLKIDISSWTILKILLILVGLYFLYAIRDIIALFVIVMILVATFSPLVNSWAKKISRPGAVLAIILLLVASVVAVISLIIPPFINQTIQLFHNAPSYLSKIEWVKDYAPQIKSNLSSLSSQLGNISGSVIDFTTGIFGGIVTVIMVIVLFIYFLLDERGVKNSLLSPFPESKKEFAAELFKKIAIKAGNWLRGQMFLGLIIGVINLIGLSIIGVPYALTLAIVSGLLEIVPTIGPIIAGMLAVLVAFSISPLTALFVLIWYIIIQQLENTLIVPKVMQKAVGLSPAVIIFAILIGAKLYGVLGVILSVPLAASLMVILQEWTGVKKLIYNQD